MLRRAVIHGFLDVDAAFARAQSAGTSAGARSGTTAVLAVVAPEYFVVGNAGDSRAVLIRAHSVVPLSRDHKPAAAPEAARIRAAGANLTRSSRPGAPVRINHTLAVSRGLGDPAFKNQPDLPPQRQPVSPEPDVRIVARVEEARRGRGSRAAAATAAAPGTDPDRFLVLACDGVWDVMSTEDVATFVRSFASAASDGAESGSSSGGAGSLSVDPRAATRRLAEALVDEAFRRGSTDNISAMVVALPDAWARC
jgi:serine/threonine protein phosphatase PrpC